MWQIKFLTYILEIVFPSLPIIMLYSLRMSVLKEPFRLSNFSVISSDISCNKLQQYAKIKNSTL